MPVTINGSTGLTGVAAIDNVSSTELGYVDGVTSAIQTQMNSKPTGGAGAWASYTPTWTNLTVGNGTLIAYYTQIGTTVHARVDFSFGSTSTIGTDPTFTLPVTSRDAGYRGGATAIGIIHMRDIGNASYGGVVFWNSTTSALMNRYAVSGSNTTIGQVTATAPFTWASGDYFTITLTYEAA